MVVANNEIDATKNAGKLTTISMTMWMRQCHAGRITQCPMKHNQGFTRSHWMPPLVECLRRIALAAAMVDNFSRKHKTLTKTIFS